MLHDPNWDKKPAQLNDISLWLLRAADYIEKYGKWDGNGQPPKSGEPACMIQALALTANGCPVIGSGVINKLEWFLHTPILWWWSDDHTKKECIKALRDCAYAQDTFVKSEV